jgi:hypothetical protein
VLKMVNFVSKNNTSPTMMMSSELQSSEETTDSKSKVSAQLWTTLMDIQRFTTTHWYSKND